MSLENKIIDYRDNEKDIIHWVKLKGEFRYQIIIDVMEKNNIPTTWKNLTNYVKYDKRLLINVFKYIVFLEEYFRSMLYKYKKINKDDLIKYEFRKTIHEFIKINNIELFDKIDLEILKEKVDSIIDFRNSVVHNKILIGQSFKGETLKNMIDIYTKILPESYRNGFISDICGCSKGLNIDEKFKY